MLSACTWKHSPQSSEPPRATNVSTLAYKWGNWRLRADCRLPPKVTSCVKTLCLCRWIRNMESPASLLGKDPLILEVLWKVHINSISLSSHFQPESECVTKLLSELTSRLTSVAGPRRAPGLGLFWSKSARHPSELSSPLHSRALAYWFCFWKTILELAMSYKWWRIYFEELPGEQIKFSPEVNLITLLFLLVCLSRMFRHLGHFR